MAAEGRLGEAERQARGDDPPGCPRGHRPAARPALGRRERGAADRRGLRARVPARRARPRLRPPARRDRGSAAGGGRQPARRRVGGSAGALRVLPRARARDARRPRSRPRDGCACTSGSPRRSSPCTRASSTPISASSPTTSSRRRRWAMSSAPSTTRPGPPTRPRAGSPTRTRRCCTPRRSTRSSCAPEPDDGRRLELLLELGETQTRASRVSHARATFERAAALARELERPEDMARAALGHLPALVRRNRRRAADRPAGGGARARSASEDSGLRAHLLSGLAQELYWVDAAGRSNDLGEEALEMARRVGDPKALAAALVRRQFTGVVGPEQVPRRLTESDEMHDLAKRMGDRELELRAHLYRLSARLQLGDIPGVDADLAAVDRLATELRQPQWLWNVPLVRATRALVDGRFDEAGELAERSAGLGDPGRGAGRGPVLRDPDGPPAPAAPLARGRRRARRAHRAAAGARGAVPGDSGMAELARRDPRRARSLDRGPSRFRDARRPETSPTFPRTPSGGSR